MASRELEKSVVAAEEEQQLEPASPTTGYLNSSVLSLAILAVFESEIPVDDYHAASLLRERFLPMNHRFSSILVRDEEGVQWWKKVEVLLQDHVKVPIFPSGLSVESYDEKFQEYISKISMDKFSETMPLWEMHFFKYPTSSAAGTIVMKLHHALGDGFSLMGTLFSCLKRADDPSLPLTFPSARPEKVAAAEDRRKNLLERVARNVMGFWNTVSDVAWSVMKSTVMADDASSIRSDNSILAGPKPIVLASATFSLDLLREIKFKVAGTVNDVITGIIFYGVHLYNQRMPQYAGAAKMTSLVLLNTRMVYGYQSVKEMLEAKSWGNRFTFLQIPIPSCNDTEKVNPLMFIFTAKKMISRKRNSMGLIVISRLLNLLEKVKSSEAVSRYIFSTIKNTSMGISNVIGPMEKIEIADHPVKNFYFVVVGMPQSLAITLMSYMGKLTVVVAAERGFIVPQLLVSCINESFDKMHQAACGNNYVIL